MAESGFYCNLCQRQTLHRKNPANHILHFLISFFTCGLWIFPWFIIANMTTNEPWRCTLCGTPTTFKAQQERAKLAAVEQPPPPPGAA